MKNYSWQHWEALYKNGRFHTEYFPFVLLGLLSTFSVCGALGPGSDSFENLPTNLRTAVGFYQREEYIREDGRMKWRPLFPSSLQVEMVPDTLVLCLHREALPHRPYLLLLEPDTSQAPPQSRDCGFPGC